MTHYTIYRITNQVSGKVYIGSHKTNNLDDGYFGSGKYLKRSIEKYGVEHFVKEILYDFDSPDLMYKKEAELVNEDFIANENTYNLKVGGSGGWHYVNGKHLNNNKTKEQLARGGIVMGIRYRDNPDRYPRITLRLKTQKRSPKFAAAAQVSMLGKHHTDESKQKISNANKGKHGILNSQFGSIWITDGTIDRKIKKNSTIPNGWYRGRHKKHFSRPLVSI